MRLSTAALCLLLQCSALGTSAFAQKPRPCPKPYPDRSLSKEQQDASDSGALAACAAANSADAHPLHKQPKPESPADSISPDDAISSDVLVSRAPTDSDYYDTLKEKGCHKLLIEAQRRAAKYSSDAGRLAFLSGIVQYILQSGSCD
jgi:hypothetical protein